MELYGQPARLSTGFIFSVLCTFTLMRTFAIVERFTAKGYHSVWHFVEGADGFYAFGGCHKPLIKKFDTRKKLQAFYNSLTRYGYKQLGPQQLELSLA